ncbi:MAG: hypothetical protein IK104_00420 [Clostridia bacterium]|nr:hypothetical protein [Clostridia bacterium]
MPNFDYENAKRDILDNGGDPDFLDYNHADKRDSYLKGMGLNPGDYSSRSGAAKNSGSSFSSSFSGSSSSSSSSILDSLFSASPSDDSCFVTTACIRARGLPDDCEELTQLRRFRDEYVLRTQDGKEDVDTYYRLAPAVVEKINARADSKEVWERVYTEMILPCLAFIREGKYEQAYRLYKEYTLTLADLPE